MLTIMRPKTTIDKIFDDFFKGTAIDDYYRNVFSPAVDIKENADHVTVKAELPGMDKKDIKVVYEHGALTISGEKKYIQEEKDEQQHVVECRYGKFQRIIPLNPEYIEQNSINAEYKNGILTVTIAKAAKSKPKLIEVSVS